MIRAIVMPLLVAVILAAAWAYLWSVHQFNAVSAEHWTWVVDYAKAYREPPAFLAPTFTVTGIALLVVLMTALALFSQIGTETRFGGRDEQTLHGSARFAKRSDVKETGLFSRQGVRLGGWPKGRSKAIPLRDDGPENEIVFAPPRSGKGAGVVIPTLLEWPHSVVVLDIRGENWANSSGYRASIGQRILKFDPTAIEGSVRFNPLAEIRIDTDYDVQDAQNIAMMIVDPDGKGLADFWAKSGFSWQTAALLYTLYKVKREEGRVASLKDVDDVLSAVDVSDVSDVGDAGENADNDEAGEESAMSRLFDAMIAFDTGRPGSTGLIRSAAADMKNRADNERSGVQSSAKIDLALYRDPIIAANISESDFSIRELMNGERPCSLYLVIPPSDINRLRPLLRIMMNLITARLMRNDESGKASYKHRLLMMLDEFTCLGKLDSFVGAMAFSSGFGVKVCLIIQDLKQLAAVYGRDNGIVGTINVKVAYAPTDVETAKLLSDMCGKTTIVQRRKSLSRSALGVSGQVSESLAEVARPLLTPDECMRLKKPKKSRLDKSKLVAPGDVLIFTAGTQPIRGRQTLYFLDKTLLRRARMTPVADATGSLAVDRSASNNDNAANADNAAAATGAIRAVLQS